MSCTKAQKYFAQHKIDIAATGDARKEKIDDAGAWALMEGADAIYIAKGKKILTHTPEGDQKEEILKAAMGRSGNLRAPTLKLGRVILVGYNDTLYPDYLK